MTFLRENVDKWATSWENLFKPYANNKGADRPARPHSLISTFVGHYLDSIIPILAKSKISVLQLVSVAEQAGLCLPECKPLRQVFSWGGLNKKFWYPKTNFGYIYFTFYPKTNFGYIYFGHVFLRSLF